jgi:hypothetical protein
MMEAMGIVGIGRRAEGMHRLVVRLGKDVDKCPNDDRRACPVMRPWNP